MAIQDLKFSSEDFEGNDIASLPDRPYEQGISAQELKARFDNVAKMMVAMGALNDLIDELTSPDGASQIGASVQNVSGGSVAAVLSSLKGYIDNGLAAKAAMSDVLTRSNTTEYTPAGEYNPATKGYVDSVAMQSGSVSSVFGRAGAVVAKPGDYNGGDITLSGYALDSTGQPVSGSDTVNTAIAKLVSQKADLSSGKLRADQASSDTAVVTASRELTPSDACKTLLVNSSSPVTITVPDQSVDLPVGCELELVRLGSGAVEIAAGSGIELLSAGSATSLGARYSAAALKRLNATQWLLTGGIA